MDINSTARTMRQRLKFLMMFAEAKPREKCQSKFAGVQVETIILKLQSKVSTAVILNDDAAVMLTVCSCFNCYKL